MFLTISYWKEAIMKCLRTDRNISFHVKDVDFLFLMPDYTQAFNKHFGHLPQDLSGMMRTQVWRHVVEATGDVFDTYQEDVAIME